MHIRLELNVTSATWSLMRDDTAQYVARQMWPSPVWFSYCIDNKVGNKHDLVDFFHVMRLSDCVTAKRNPTTASDPIKIVLKILYFETSQLLVLCLCYDLTILEKLCKPSSVNIILQILFGRLAAQFTFPPVDIEYFVGLTRGDPTSFHV
jgi:hypothetical protein